MNHVPNEDWEELFAVWLYIMFMFWTMPSETLSGSFAKMLSSLKNPENLKKSTAQYSSWVLCQNRSFSNDSSKVYFFFLHIHTVRLQYYTLTYIKYRMFLKLLQRGANVWQFISEIFFFFQQAAQSHFKPAAVKVMWEICCHLWIISYM